jgi:hypothetical protein
MSPFGLFKSKPRLSPEEQYIEEQVTATRALLKQVESAAQGLEGVDIGELSIGTVSTAGLETDCQSGDLQLSLGLIAHELADADSLGTDIPEFDEARYRNASMKSWVELRNVLRRKRSYFSNYEDTIETWRSILREIAFVLFRALPEQDAADGEDDSLTVEVAFIDAVDDVHMLINEAVHRPILAGDAKTLNIFQDISARLWANIKAQSPKDGEILLPFEPAARKLSKRQVVDAYLGGTPFHSLFLSTSVPITIPLKSRFEHHHIIAGSGHGKTQTLQFLIAQDLPAVERGERSVVVIDSQGDLIYNISNLAQFAPGAPLHDRIVIIDPTDVEWPVSLNLFDVGRDRFDQYSPLERERLTNSILELYDFVLGSLLSAEMTQKQAVIFRYVTRLMLHIPDATIHTLRELMEPGSEVKFAQDISKLTGTARHFFETEFTSREFEQTKKQVLRRLWGILENQTFERMFSHPRSKLDLYSEMNAGKVILINTAKDLLKEQGTEIFGRFFIAMITQAAQERATIPEARRMPTFVYVDEAADYFDHNIGIILSQARKYNVGMILAHQYLGQLEPRLQEAFAANTSIKFVGGVSAKDARAMAQALYCDASLIEGQPKGSFAAHIRGVSKRACSVRFPFGHMEEMEVMPHEERMNLQRLMRSKYAVHYSELAGVKQPEDEAPPHVESTSHVEPTSQDSNPPSQFETAATTDDTQTGSVWPDDDIDKKDTKASPTW